PLADDAPLTASQKLEDRLDFRTSLRVGLELPLGLFKRQAAAVQRPIRALDRLNRLRREAAPLEALAVDAGGAGHVARRHDVGRDVLRNEAAHAGEGMRADAHELVHQGGGAEDHPVFHDDVTGKLGAVGEDRLVADLAVVREVDVGHDPVFVADARDAGVLHRAAVDRHVLADGVVVADLDAGGLALVFLVLRRRANGGEVEDAVAPPDAHAAVDHHVGADPAALPDLGVRADDRVRADLDVVREPRARVHQRARMDAAGHGSAGRIASRMVASAAISVPTRATHENLPMPRSMRSTLTSISSWSPGITGFLKRA